MAIVMRFTPRGLTHDKYNQVMKRLEEAGAGAPRGRMQHYFFGDKNNLFVSESCRKPGSIPVNPSNSKFTI